jgi:hypothetical protein
MVPSCPLCGVPVPLEAGEDPDEKVARHIDAGCTRETAATRKTRLPCTKRGCPNTEAVPVVCRACHANYCFRHRFPSDHDCPAKPGSREPSPTRSKSTAAAAAPPPPPSSDISERRAEKLAELHKKANKSRGSLWHKVEVMRNKARATGDGRVPAERRFYVEVVFPFDSGVEPRHMFLDSAWTVGKALDKIAEAGAIPNKNAHAPPGAPRLALIALVTGTLLDTRATLASLEPSTLRQGDPILLETTDILSKQ